MDLFTEVPREVVLVVQAGILLFVVAAEELVRRVHRRLRGRAVDAGSTPAGDAPSGTGGGEA